MAKLTLALFYLIQNIQNIILCDIKKLKWFALT